MRAFIVMIIVVASFALASLASAAETRNYLLTQRFMPTSAAASTDYADDLVALRGETEGMQLAVRPTLAECPAPSCRLHAELDAANPGTTGFLKEVSVRFLRVGFVNVKVKSTGTGLRTGSHADPLPPLTPVGMTALPNLWGGFVMMVDVPANAAAGTYSSAISISNDVGEIIVRVPFTFKVSTVAAIDRNDPAAFKAFVGFNATYYRNAFPSSDHNKQFQNFFDFLAQHRMTPTDWIYGKPGSTGNYDLGAQNRLANYAALPYTAKSFPHTGSGYNMWTASAAATKTYVQNVFGQWNRAGHVGTNTWAYTFDEPLPATELTRVPQINKLVRTYAPGVKTYLTTSPRVKTRDRTFCTQIRGLRRCKTFRGERYSNQNLWNGGLDDANAIVPATHRFYGRYTSPLEIRNGVSHTFDTYNNVLKVRKAGRETWSYSYFMPTKYVPQLAIDSPATDPRMLFMWNASVKNTGWLQYQIARWIPGSASTGTTAVRDPYSDTLAYDKSGLKSNGDTSLIYPGAPASYDLAGDTTVAPVSSLRFETMRDGIEDVDLVTLYRARYGTTAVGNVMKYMFSSVRTVPNGGYTWPSYNNNGLATRMEDQRRIMIAKLELP